VLALRVRCLPGRARSVLRSSVAAYDGELEPVEVEEIDPMPEGEQAAWMACGAEILGACGGRGE